MISEPEFVAEQLRLGRSLHEHNGVWWEQVRPLYCKPVFEFAAFRRGSARPARRRSVLGYSHQVSIPDEANKTVTFMVLEGEDLRHFGIQRVRSSKRSQIRKGLSCCDVRRLRDLDAVLERMRAINIAQARRFEGLGERGSFLSPAYYEEQAERWRADIRRDFTHRGKSWWGAFREDVLVGYLVCIEVGQVRMIGAVKSDPAHSQFCPVDALYCRVLEAAGRDLDCRQVINGGTNGERAGLTHYKEQFLFRRTEFPYFASSLAVEQLARRTALRISTALGRIRGHRAVDPD